MTDPAPRRLVLVLVSAEVVAGLCREGPPGRWWRVSKGLPPDAELVRVSYEFQTDRFALVFSHPSFPAFPEGYDIPPFSPQLDSLDVPAVRQPSAAEMEAMAAELANAKCGPVVVIPGPAEFDRYEVVVSRAWPDGPPR